MSTEPKKTFIVRSGRACMTDPCYTKNLWCNIHLPAKNGVWEAAVETSDQGDWGIRVSRLVAWHQDHGRPENGAAKTLDQQVGVDSGQAGIFDAAAYPDGDTGESRDPDTFYGRACATSGSEDQWGVIEEGVVTRSGFGDGGYTARGVEEDGEYVYLEIIFIADEDDEEARNYTMDYVDAMDEE